MTSQPVVFASVKFTPYNTHKRLNHNASATTWLSNRCVSAQGELHVCDAVDCSHHKYAPFEQSCCMERATACG
eukprot:349652-Chlamydomonas_euryale.AAC.3